MKVALQKVRFQLFTQSYNQHCLWNGCFHLWNSIVKTHQPAILCTTFWENSITSKKLHNCSKMLILARYVPNGDLWEHCCFRWTSKIYLASLPRALLFSVNLEDYEYCVFIHWGRSWWKFDFLIDFLFHIFFRLKKNCFRMVRIHSIIWRFIT